MRIAAWLLPPVPPSFNGSVRTIGEPDKAVRKSASYAKWLRSPKGRAFFKEWRSRPEVRRSENERKKRWMKTPSGKAWYERHRQRRRDYQMLRYHTDGGKRRAYLNEKQREYRARKKAAAIA